MFRLIKHGKQHLLSPEESVLKCAFLVEHVLHSLGKIDQFSDLLTYSLLMFQFLCADKNKDNQRYWFVLSAVFKEDFYVISGSAI